ncbi:MAG: outer membrane lipoprotein-sorting protein [Bdellovibrionales bacterium]|jgi:outer membrane lipoprotein-sorting protein|nr:outer membrane lipoprotein-sorting protein [Bdellovibrionales bacterium]MBT3525943.1 outer membrane lipoprotein-sorting protein [Bdellovibrionales bacterium]MBT7668803.1 outer membrane lipoprotein-sorting protein [Bdellovibrionales bacterium]MBT7767080.1 outer membrane lipoprotein-sorting protein [Bdellovibrionales bacterium]
MRCLVILLSLVYSVSGLAISADKILERADRIRNPSNSYLMEVEVISSQKTSLFQVMLQGDDKTLIKTLAPKRDKGRNLLMLGEKMWVYIPNLRRAMRVSLAQKISGQAANGDISRMKWGGDYRPEIKSEDSKGWTLFLKAKKKGLTYDQLRIQVAKKTFRPLRAEFLTVSGKVIKSAKYQGYRQLLGAVRPTRIEIEDAIRPDLKTIINIKSMKNRSFNARIFQQKNLK